MIRFFWMIRIDCVVDFYQFICEKGDNTRTWIGFKEKWAMKAVLHPEDPELESSSEAQNLSRRFFEL